MLGRLLSPVALAALLLGCQRVELPERPLAKDAQYLVSNQLFEELVQQHRDLTYEEFAAEAPHRDYPEKLSFDVTQAKFYDRTVTQLQLNEKEKELLARNGFVSVDHDQRYSFGSMYYGIYTRDLPVLITTDSILHALHRSYDDVLMQMEQTFLTAALDQVLTLCHEELSSLSQTNQDKNLTDNYRDVDLYLTVARNLLKGAGAPEGDATNRTARESRIFERENPGAETPWNGDLLVASKLNQDEAALTILKLVQSLQLQNPMHGDSPTQIYGGQRPIDYSQFQPRGHYTKHQVLKRYFRAMMWLGRADTGFNVLPPDEQSGIVCDSRRELRDAILLTELFQATGMEQRLGQMDALIAFMVGQSDNLSVFSMAQLLTDQKVATLADTSGAEAIDRLQQALLTGNYAQQQIRSQLVFSNPDSSEQVHPPALFQMFGQRYIIDSFVLSKVVYDSILFEGHKMQRMMPQGLDVMCALGNQETIPFLADDLIRFQYSANLKASQDFVERHEPDFWEANLYNIWLDALRTLDDDHGDEQHFPQAMRTHAWQMKQLQTQLASWSELRHNTVLYAKQSYTAGVVCEYPAGYVEPYPQLYARIKLFAEEATRRIEATDYRIGDPKKDAMFAEVQKRQVAFFKQMANKLARLETLATKELSAESFTQEEQAWLKKTIDKRGGGSGAPRYDGWYCDLFYQGGTRAEAWDPTIVDVHTDPNTKEVLEVGVGNCNFLVVAIDNEDDRMVFVGPAYSYYEFRESADNRLTDEQWQSRLNSGTPPPRPQWTTEFQGPRQKRELSRPQPRTENGRGRADTVPPLPPHGLVPEPPRPNSVP